MLEYIQQELDKKNKNIYFKKNRWVLHINYWAFVFYRGQSFLPEFDWSLNYFLFAFLITNIGVALFYYFYCLYLVPVFFKRNQYLKFWIYFFVSLFVISSLDFLWNVYGSQFYPKGFTEMYKFNFKEYFQLIGQGYFLNFILFSALLYLIEISEGIHTWKQIKNTQTEISQTEKHLANTHLAPNFIMESLDNIIDLMEKNNDQSADITLQFSDVLRYKLYQSEKSIVDIKEELKQLENLISLHNINKSTSTTIEIQHDQSVDKLEPLHLIKLIEPYLDTFEKDKNWALDTIILIEQKELTIAINISTTVNNFTEKLISIENLLHKNSSLPITFTNEFNNPNFTIQICQKILN